MRPDRLIAVTATGTEIGKTWVAAHVATSLRDRGFRVAARKPAQSFDPDDSHPTDAEVLADATREWPHDVCPQHRWYPTPLAPPMAAHALGLPPFTIADLTNELVWPDAIQIGIIEGAGGIHSPLADDGDSLTLIDTIQPDLVIVVADPELGTINNIRLTTGALRQNPYVVHLNRYDGGDDLHRRNHEWLTDRDQLTVTTSIDMLASILTEG
jgi:dethiobiotin synthetase